MHAIVGAIFVLLGAACFGYYRSGAATFAREPPMLAVGVLLTAIGVGMWGRSRVAGLLARFALGVLLLVVTWILVTSYLPSGSLHETDELVRRVRLLGGATVAFGVVVLFLLVRRTPRAKKFRAIDLVPLTGVAAAVMLAVLWVAGDDPRLRPCRLGSDPACEIIATRLLESAERKPGASPTRWEERAARVLEARACSGSEPGPCALWSYAAGSVAARAGRIDDARRALLRACELDRSWCARAAQERGVAWTPEESARLERAR
jgi:hypothetical protein